MNTTPKTPKKYPKNDQNIRAQVKKVIGDLEHISYQKNHYFQGIKNH